MDRILDIKRCGRGWQYLVEWQGYPPEERFWIPRRQTLDPRLLEYFYRSQPDKPGRAPGDAPRGGGDVGVKVDTQVQPSYRRVPAQCPVRLPSPAVDNQPSRGDSRQSPDNGRLSGCGCQVPNWYMSQRWTIRMTGSSVTDTLCVLSFKRPGLRVTCFAQQPGSEPISVGVFLR